MILLALMTVVSIIGRSLAGVSIEGDYELVEMGLAISVFMFLPECHQQRGHIIVDFFTLHASKKTLLLLEIVGDLSFTILAGTLVWQISLAGIEAHEYQEQSMILELQVWMAYIPAVLSVILLFLCCAYSCILGSREYFKHE